MATNFFFANTKIYYFLTFSQTSRCLTLSDGRGEQAKNKNTIRYIIYYPLAEFGHRQNTIDRPM